MLWLYVCDSGRVINEATHHLNSNLGVNWSQQLEGKRTSPPIAQSISPIFTPDDYVRNPILFGTHYRTISLSTLYIKRILSLGGIKTPIPTIKLHHHSQYFSLIYDTINLCIFPNMRYHSLMQKGI